MKYLFIRFYLLLIFCLFYLFPFCQNKEGGKTIENIFDMEDVERFIKEELPAYNISYREPDNYHTYFSKIGHIYNYFSDSLNISTFFKFDFTHNGRPDLFVNAFWGKRTAILIVLDKGEGNYSFFPFVNYFRRSNDISFIKLDTSYKVPLLTYYHLNIDSLLNSMPVKNLHEEYKTGY